MNWISKKSLAAITLGLTITGFASPAFAASYQVQPNDSFWKIAKANHVSVDSLLASNPNVNPLNLQVDQTIQIPATGKKYVVSQNETFWTISHKLHIPLNSLMAANSKIDPLNLYPGIVLSIPQAQGASGQSLSSPSSSGQASSGNASRGQASGGQTMKVDGSSAQEISPTITTNDGKARSYSKKISGYATAYTASAASNGQWGATDYFGNPLRLGTIAVDPSVIPLGSKVFIKGYSFNGLPVGGMVANAVDEGGAVKGNHIDIFVPTSDGNASNFGIQNVSIYVLK